MTRLGVLILVFWSCSAAAQDVGRQLNWQDTTSPNFPETLPGEQEPYRLPGLPEPDTSSTQTPLSQSPKIYVSQINIEGVTAFSNDEITAVVKPYVGREVALEELQGLRLELSKMYAAKGYINSGVVIPQQTPVNGAIRMQAIEGDLTRIRIAPETRLSDRYLSRRIRRHLNSPLNIRDLQYALQWLQMDGNVKRLDARLAPGDQLGESELNLAVDEPSRVNFSMTADNYGTTSVGAERGRGALSFRNLTGKGEVVRLSAGVSEGAADGSALFDIPITRWNTRFQAYYANSNSKIIEQQFEALDIQSDTETYGLTLIQPLVDRLDSTLLLTLGVENKTSSTELLGLPFSLSPGAVDGDAETAPVLVGLDWTRRLPNSVTSLRATYRKGVDILNVSKFEPVTEFDQLLNPTGADGEFDVYLLQGLFLYRLNQFSVFSSLDSAGQLILRTTAQIASDPLMSLEKISIGGANTVRGYSENLLVRDNGISATIELQIPMPGYRPPPHPRSLIVAPFVDYGRSWDEVDTDPGSSLRNTDDARAIAGAGLGLIWKPIRGLNLQLYWGADIYDNFDGDDPRDNDQDSDLQDEGIHILLSYNFPF